MCKAMRAVLRSDAILIEDGEAGKLPLACGQDYRIWPRSDLANLLNQPERFGFLRIGISGSASVGSPMSVQLYHFEVFTTENTEDHGAPQEFFMLEHHTLTERIIGLAIEVHRTVGPGLLESVYAECMALELAHAGIGFEAQVTVRVIYKGITIALGFRADAVVENTLILESKTVAALLPAHASQFLTDLRTS